MADYDVFNGDADGICALLQLRLADPRDATLVTGVKRDIDLLKQVDVKAGDRITVLDISMDKNSAALATSLEKGAAVTYICLLYTSPSPRDGLLSRMPSSA